MTRLSQSDKKKLLNASVEYIAQDIRPFKAIENPGFLKLADCLVCLGAQYGNFDVKKALPSRHTAKRHAVQQVEEKQQEVINHFLSAIKANGYVGITTDMWTDGNSRSYLSLTLHFVEKGFLHHCVIAVNPHVSDIKSGKNMREEIVTFFDKYEVSQDVLKEHCLFVSDNGSNMILALNEFQRIPCACHMLATVLSHTLQLKSLSKNCCPINENGPSLSVVEDIKSTVAAVKSITTYFKQTGLNEKVENKFKAEQRYSLEHNFVYITVV